MKTLLRLVMIVAVLMGTALPLVHPRVTHATGAGAIQGTLFFDANADGVRNAGEAGIETGANVTIEIRDLATGGQVFLANTTTSLGGAYTMSGLDANVYVVTEVNAPSFGYTRTTPNTRQVTVGTAPVTGIDFGVSVLLTITGVVFDDVNQNGIRNLGEPPIPNTLVDVYRDLNANGLVEDGEPQVGTGTSNAQGVYVVTPSLWPNVYVVRFQPPSGVGAPTQVPAPIVGQDGVSVYRLDFGVNTAHSGAASVTGKTWKDLDGDEIMDGDEGPLPNVAVALIRDSNTNGQIDPGESVAAQGVSDSQGVYTLSNLTADAYVLRVDDLTIPAGWVPSFDPTLLAFNLASGEARTNFDLGYYDPLVVAPMRAADWKNEIRRTGRPRYSVAEVNAFIATAQTASGVFPEITPLVDALLRPTQGDEGQARKEYAALQLNVASGRLLARTPIRLSTLTTATTVGGAVAEIERLLKPAASQLNATYRRLRSLAETLNKGEGVGYGLTNVSATARAIYRGADVTSVLRRGGDVVDLMLGEPLYVTRWSPGNLDPGINVFRPRVRVRVNTFYNGGVLDAFQKLPNGDLVSLGTIVPPFWNKDVKSDYTFDLWRVSNLSDLVSTEIRLVTRDSDGGSAAHIKIDAAEMVFDY